MAPRLHAVIDGAEVWSEGEAMYIRPAPDATLPGVVRHGLRIRMEAALGGSCATEGCPGGTIQRHSLDCPANGRNASVETAMEGWARAHPKKYRRMVETAINIGTLVGGAEVGVLTPAALDALIERQAR